MGFDDMADLVLRTTTRVLRTSLSVTYTQGELEPIAELRATFDSAHVEVDSVTGLPVHSEQPVLGVRVADLHQRPAKGDLVELSDGRQFEVNRAEEDGHGGADLFLHEVTA